MTQKVNFCNPCTEFLTYFYNGFFVGKMLISYFLPVVAKVFLFPTAAVKLKLSKFSQHTCPVPLYEASGSRFRFEL